VHHTRPVLRSDRRDPRRIRRAVIHHDHPRNPASQPAQAPPELRVTIAHWNNDCDFSSVGDAFPEYAVGANGML